MEYTQTNTEPNTTSRRGPILERTAFVIDRTLEFFTQSELTTQIGYGPRLWPLVLAKELIDNALDACETGANSPDITVELEPDALTVSDNGPAFRQKSSSSRSTTTFAFLTRSTTSHRPVVSSAML